VIRRRGGVGLKHEHPPFVSRTSERRAPHLPGEIDVREEPFCVCPHRRHERPDPHVNIFAWRNCPGDDVARVRLDTWRLEESLSPDVQGDPRPSVLEDDQPISESPSIYPAGSPNQTV
jgi:hypothetical protein